MPKTGWFTKILALLGTILVWIPILAPILLSAAFFVAEHLFRFDYLMPAELFPSAIAGGLLLIWAGLRLRAQLKLISWGLAVSTGMLVGAQLLAEATGLASGEIEPAGIWFTLVTSSLVIFILAVIGMGIGGIILLRELYKSASSASELP
jgi:hypothetical protein